MGDKTGIQWTEATWNPITGCSVVSPGCTNCYAMREAGGRLRNLPAYEGLTDSSKAGPVWNGKVRLLEDRLDQPLRWRKPRRIFVNSMGDLFHEGIPDEYIDKVFAVMALAPQHVFQVLTKRSARMRKWAQGDGRPRAEHVYNRAHALSAVHQRSIQVEWPLPNVHFGVSVEDQARAEERIPHLLDTPAAVRWISAEPLLGPVDWIAVIPKKGLVHWVVVGGESGPGARPMDIDWAMSLIGAGHRDNMAVFVKQLGSRPVAKHIDDGHLCPLPFKHSKGGDPAEWPADLRVREYPA